MISALIVVCNVNVSDAVHESPWPQQLELGSLLAVPAVKETLARSLQMHTTITVTSIIYMHPHAGAEREC